MTDETTPYNVLFLCTGNSARSIMAEAYLNKVGQGRFRAYSAGSHPGGLVNPFAVDVLTAADVSTEGARSKSWDEFAEPGAPQMDFIFTVCDNAAGEVCPIWPGHPTSAHWPFEDPAAFEGNKAETRIKFVEVFSQIRRRIDILTSLPIAKLDRLALKRKLDDIGHNLAGAD
jgi:arsenate reductase